MVLQRSGEMQTNGCVARVSAVYDTVFAARWTIHRKSNKRGDVSIKGLLPRKGLKFKTLKVETTIRLRESSKR